MSDMTPARRMWAAAAMAIIEDDARRIAAARTRKKYIRICDNTKLLIGTEAEIAQSIRVYLHSRDWQIVSSCAGITVGPDQVMAAILRAADELTEDMEARKAPRKLHHSGGKPKSDPPHGTRNRYNHPRHKCRCDDCCRASREYYHNRREVTA